MVSKKVTYALLATAAAVGAGYGVVYYMKKKSVVVAETRVSVELEKSHISWLEEQAKTYTNGDISKAIQQVIAYCVKTCESTAGANNVFKEIRCNSCGDKDKAALSTVFLEDHVNFSTEAMKTHDVESFDKVIRIMFEYVINDVNVAVVFSG